MKDQNNSRRLFLQKFFSTGLVIVAGGAFLSSCNSETKEDAKKVQDTTAKAGSTGSAKSEEIICGDYSNVSKEELDKRKKFGYVDQAPDPERECMKCNLFIPKGEEKTCGGCILFKGPVNKEGNCTYWVEQVS